MHTFIYIYIYIYIFVNVSHFEYHMKVYYNQNMCIINANIYTGVIVNKLASIYAYIYLGCVSMLVRFYIFTLSLFWC